LSGSKRAIPKDDTHSGFLRCPAWSGHFVCPNFRGALWPRPSCSPGHPTTAFKNGHWLASFFKLRARCRHVVQNQTQTMHKPWSPRIEDMLCGMETAPRFTSKDGFIWCCAPPHISIHQRRRLFMGSPPLRDLDLFADWTARILVRAAKALKAGQPLCFVKTDVKYKNALLPIGFRIAEQCEKLGLPIQAHWIWQRLSHFSPYTSSLANIFVLGHANTELLRWPGVLRTSDCNSRKLPTSFTPELFQQLIQQLTPLNGRVLDPFAGIGSTILAASRCQRWAVGVEVSRDQFLKAKHILRSVSAVDFRSLREDRGRH
jgi:hypothetical protein